jgi:phage terminase large subunit-like protein
MGRRAALEAAAVCPPPWEAPGLSRVAGVIAFLEDLEITAGKRAGTKLRLRPWQRKFVKAVYRTDKRGVRPIRTAVLSMARKNGKSQLAAALALCHLCGPEAESRGEIYSCANDRFQSARIFNEMVALIGRHPALSARTNVVSFRKEIHDLVNGSVYAALTAEPRTKLGLSPSFVIYDELGSAPDRALYDAMDSAMGARENPLMLVISTQAADDFAPMSQLVDYGLKVRAREIKDSTFHLSLHCAQPDDDPWALATWRKANPALNDFRSLEDVKRLAARAQRMPGQENAFRNMILNMRVSAHTPFIERAVWKACGGAADVQPGSRIYAALDLGSTRDMSALVLIAEDLEGAFHVEPFYWLPGNVEQRESEDRAPYGEWVREGYLESIGEATDPKVIALKIAELNGQYGIRALAYDRWRIGDLRRELDAIGCTVQLVPHGQGFRDMSPAVDILERLIIQRRIRHGNHPVLTMNAAAAIVTRDAAGGRKLDKAKSNGRIDGLVALAMAFNIALAKQVAPVIDVNALIG